jgi:hypothetical protein
MEIKNQRIGTITIPHKWQIKIPSEIINPKILKIPDQNIKDFITLVGVKLLEYESLRIQLGLYYKSIDNLETNPEEQIRDFKLNNLLYEKN